MSAQPERRKVFIPMPDGSTLFLEGVLPVSKQDFDYLIHVLNTMRPALVSDHPNEHEGRLANLRQAVSAFLGTEPGHDVPDDASLISSLRKRTRDVLAQDATVSPKAVGS